MLGVRRGSLQDDAHQAALRFLLGDLAVGVPGLLQVIGVAVVWDVLLTPFVLPVMMRLFSRLEPRRQVVY